MEQGKFPTDLLGCCNIKDCSVESCCKIWFCLPCIYGSAIEAAELGSCLPCCVCFVLPITMFVGAYNRGKLAEKYNIDESMAMTCALHICCHACATIQDVNLIITKEGRTWGCGGLDYDKPGAPVASEMMSR